MSETLTTTQARVPRAWVTYSIIGLCVLVYALELLVPTFLSYIALSAWAGGIEPWRYLTSAFAHSLNPAHILLNMYVLWSLGPTIEVFVGRWRFAAIYLISALAGSVAFVWTSPPQAWVVGASGAVFGLFGALLVLYRLVGASSKSLWIMVAINFAMGFVIPNVAWQAHLGGFVAGAACAWLIGREAKAAVRGTRQGSLLPMAGCALGIVGLAALRYLIV